MTRAEKGPKTTRGTGRQIIFSFWKDMVRNKISIFKHLQGYPIKTELACSDLPKAKMSKVEDERLWINEIKYIKTTQGDWPTEKQYHCKVVRFPVTFILTREQSTLWLEYHRMKVRSLQRPSRILGGLWNGKSSQQDSSISQTMWIYLLMLHKRGCCIHRSVANK